MVTRWGMSDAIGPIQLPEPAGPALPGSVEVSPDTLRAVDAEVHAIVDDAHRTVIELLTKHRDALERLAHALLDHETLDEHEARSAAGTAPDGGARQTPATAGV